ncbi:hypothetical protein HanPSC8_Chr10g0431651 [Helianthus annuus]|nr:hypothetical protein HanPSC8_Chr10g0431651 [Helianthus annuus]
MIFKQHYFIIKSYIIAELLKKKVGRSPKNEKKLQTAYLYLGGQKKIITK